MTQRQVFLIILPSKIQFLSYNDGIAQLLMALFGASHIFKDHLMGAHLVNFLITAEIIAYTLCFDGPLVLGYCSREI